MGDMPTEAFTGWTWACPVIGALVLVVCLAGALLTRQRR